MDWDELICIHEAAHTVVAVAVGHHQNGAAVEKTERGCRGIAEHSPAMLTEGTPDHPTFEDFDKLLPDFRKATAYAQLAVGTVGWLKYLRTLWLRTDSILERHRLATKMLASELSEKGVVRRDPPKTFSTDGCRYAAARCWSTRLPTARLPVRRIHCGNSAVNVGGGPSRQRATVLSAAGRGRSLTLKRSTRNFSASGGLAAVPRVARRWDGCAPRSRKRPRRAPGRGAGKTLCRWSPATTQPGAFSQGNSESKSKDAWCAVSRCGSGLIAMGVRVGPVFEGGGIGRCARRRFGQ